MEKPVENWGKTVIMEADLSCPWWELCLSRKCWKCIQANAQRRARARSEAAQAQARELEQAFDRDVGEQLRWDV